MRHVPCELAAVLYIFSCDDELKRKALRHVDVDRQVIDWDSIFKEHFGDGHRAAVLWAYALWKDQSAQENLFEAAFSMDAGLRRVVLRAIAIRWTLLMDNVAILRCA